jgi:hypothetical protein
VISLLSVEVRRGLARRVVRVLLLLNVLVIAVAGIILFARSSAATPQTPPTGVPSRVPTEVICKRPAPGDTGPPQCTQTFGVSRPVDKRFHLVDLWKRDGGGILGATASILLIGAILCGASMAGADWRAGTMTTLLTWEPRRVRVFLAKIGAYVVVALVVAVLLQVLVSLALLPSAVWRGTTAGTDATWYRGYVGGLLRISVLAAMGSGVGFSVATISRNTAGAVGVLFGYLAVAEALIRGVRPGWQKWLFGDNSTVFLTGHSLRGASFRRSPLLAAVLITVYFAIIAAVALGQFVRRDVT